MLKWQIYLGHHKKILNDERNTANTGPAVYKKRDFYFLQNDLAMAYMKEFLFWDLHAH
jgi:hypothetical protein